MNASDKGGATYALAEALIGVSRPWRSRHSSFLVLKIPTGAKLVDEGRRHRTRPPGW